MLKSINPSNSEVLEEYGVHTDPEIDARLARTHAAQKAWCGRPIRERLGTLAACAERLREREDDLAALMADEVGKPITEGAAEVRKCAWVCDYYAENAEAFLADETVEADATKSYVAYRPLGTVLAVMPWNYPLWQVFRAAAPTLAAGNAMVLKHASNVTGCALAIEGLIRDSGAEDCFATLLLESSRVEQVIRDARIAAVTVTGSLAAGRAVAAVAGGSLKKCVLELGGSDPYLVLDDADVEAAAAACAKGRLVNNGQSCIAAKRLIVHDAIASEFEEALVEEFQRRVVGSPHEEATDLGPMAREDLRDELAGQVRASMVLGAEPLCGGVAPDGAGAWFPPTVLRNVTPAMAVASEETFGPVAVVMRVSSDDEAVALANDTPFGLGSAVFSKNVDRAERIARDQLHAGAAFVNQPVASDPRLPFGGVKDSGYGRELGRWGIREFVNTKAVVIE